MIQSMSGDSHSLRKSLNTAAPGASVESVALTDRRSGSNTPRISRRGSWANTFWATNRPMPPAPINPMPSFFPLPSRRLRNVAWPVTLLAPSYTLRCATCTPLLFQLYRYPNPPGYSTTVPTVEGHRYFRTSTTGGAMSPQGTNW
jgi:hypothetical protein